MNKPPEWMTKQVETFHERVHMLALAMIHKYGKVPMLFCDDARTGGVTGQVAAFFDETKFVAEVDGELLEQAKHGARAWALWTSVLPERALILLTVSPTECKVTIEEKTKEAVLRMLNHQIEVQEGLEREAKAKKPGIH